MQSSLCSEKHKLAVHKICVFNQEWSSSALGCRHEAYAWQAVATGTKEFQQKPQEMQFACERAMAQALQGIICCYSCHVLATLCQVNCL